MSTKNIMIATANILCYKWKTLSNGECPLMLCVYKDGKRKYRSLGISINPKYWDFEKNQLKANCPNRAYLNKVISDKLKSVNDEIIRLHSENRDLTATSILNICRNTRKAITVGDLFKQYIQRLDDENRRGYMLSVKQVYNSMVAYNGHLDIYFSEIDVIWLRNYETWLRKSGLAENTIGIRFRTLRAVYNDAIEAGIVKAESYPFDAYKVSKLHQDTAKRALSKNDMERVLNYKSSNRYVTFSVDIFAFTYYAGGINFTDIANLVGDNIIDDRLVYTRQKTGKLIKIPLPSHACALIDKYHDDASPYLFPILSTFHKTQVQKANRIHKVITKVNDRLKQIGEELDLPITLTTYVARHSQATIMKRAGVSVSVIREIMGHSSERVTQIYLDSFDNDQIESAMKNLL
jgi:integrase